MKISKYLDTEKSIKIQILIFLEFSYIYSPFRRWYNRLYLGYSASSDHPGFEGFDDNKDRSKHTEVSSQLGFPKQHPFVIFHKRCSSAYMIYVILRSVLPWKIIISMFNTRLPPHCYLLGRFLLFGPAVENFGALVSFYHLSWRCGRGYLSRYCRLDVAAFLLHDKLAIERNFDREGEVVDVGKLSSIDRYLCSIMYYLSPNKEKYVYRCRPNRTREAHNDLMRLTALIVRWVLVSAVFFFFICIPFIVYSIFSDVIYVQDFPNCTPQLDELYQKKQLRWYSFTIKGHRGIARIFDTIENNFIWADNDIAGTIVFGLSYLLNEDLLIYWQHVHEQLRKLLYKVRLGHYKLQLSRLSNKRTYGDLSFRLNLLDNFHHLESTDNETLEAQLMLHDFFKQIKHVDSHISKVVGMGLLVWLTYFSCTAYVSLTQPAKLVPIRVATCVMFTTLFIVSLIMFDFRRKVLRTHSIICSLMAYDVSLHKMKYTNILDYYTTKNRAAYTLLGHPYTPATLLTIVGWTISCGTIVDSYALRQRLY